MLPGSSELKMPKFQQTHKLLIDAMFMECNTVVNIPKWNLYRHIFVNFILLAIWIWERQLILLTKLPITRLKSPWHAWPQWRAKILRRYVVFFAVPSSFLPEQPCCVTKDMHIQIWRYRRYVRLIVLTLTEEFAVDLDSCLSYEISNIPCLWPITDLIQLKIH